MQHGKTKKGLLGTGIAVLGIAVERIVAGAPVEGGILVALAVALVVAYDYLDDRVKGEPELPEGVDPEFFQRVAEELAKEINRHRGIEELYRDDGGGDSVDE